MQQLYSPSELWRGRLKGYVGKEALYTLLHSGQLRAVRVGRKFLVTESAVMEFLEGTGGRVNSRGPDQQSTEVDHRC